MKFIGTLLTAAVMGTVALSGTAAAQWATTDLAMVVYNAGDNQVMVSLLDTLTADVSLANVELAPAGTVNLGQFPTVSQWADLRMGSFGGQLAGADTQEWFVTTQPIAPGVSQSALLSFNSNNTSSKTGAASMDAGLTGISILGSDSPLSYNTKMNSSGATPGQYGGFNNDWRDGEATLAALDGGGYQDMYLYRFDAVTLHPGATTDFAAILRLNADGSVLLNPVPEPTSLVLIGSSILGLVGLRRKLVA